MRFMMLMMPAPGAYDQQPDPEFFAAMMRYNEELGQTGALLALEGLHAPADGARVTFKAGASTVFDGPFTEAKEVVGGYWLIDVASKAEALAWAQRCPAADGDTIEVRRVQEMADFSPEIIEATKDSVAALSEYLPDAAQQK